MVAENYRFFPAERTVRRMLDTGMAGRVSSAVCIDRRDQPSHTQGPWVKSLEVSFPDRDRGASLRQLSLPLQPPAVVHLREPPTTHRAVAMTRVPPLRR